MRREKISGPIKIKTTWGKKIIQKYFNKEYRAYNNAHERKLTDQLIKQKIQDLLLTAKENLFKLVQYYFKSGNKDKAEFSDSICTELDLFRNTVKNSEYGFHPKNQSLTEDLEEDYSHIIKADASMIYYADEISENTRDLQLKAMSGNENQSELVGILNYLNILKDIFKKRKDYVSGISQILEIKEPKK